MVYEKVKRLRENIREIGIEDRPSHQENKD
jgi:hypothetical protein